MLCILQRGPEMQRIAEALQLAVIIHCGRTAALEVQGPQKFDLFLSGIAAQEFVVQKLFEARLQREGLLRRQLDKLKTLQAAGSKTAVQGDFHAEGFQVDVPGVDDRVEERYAILDGYVKDVGVEELQN